ncbi:hypothetical protein ABVK25_001438 [Lepraria finkii]|uniref:Rhodopsin domain-containing protein n=1 Tax=Lepraria finkii TaxID=1340010 RepID=A0ABR4BLN7_9LECA
MALDLVIVALPLPTIWTLQMPLRRKIGVSFLFSLGLRTIGIMAWRIQSTVQAIKSSGVLYHLYFTTIQSHLEIWLGIIGASLPKLAPIASKLVVPAFSRFLSSRRKLAVPSGSDKNAIRTISGSGDDVPLQRTGFSRLDGKSLVGFGDV